MTSSQRLVLCLCFNLFCFLCLAANSSPLPTYSKFEEFMRTYNRAYSSNEELSRRYSIFARNYRLINEINAKQSDYVLAVNQFADLTDEEFEEKYNGLKRKSPKEDLPCKEVHKPGKADTEIDWRKKGVVARVKNQQVCGSCWTFTAVGALESFNAIKTGKLVEYSEQELVDCSKAKGNNGCNGGELALAFEYVAKNGISLEKEYPYEGKDLKCRKKSSSLIIKGCVNVTANSSRALLEALNIGPVAIALNALSPAFRFYKSGIITGDCPISLTHGVLLVGASMDKRKNIPYWIIKNSWGLSWGIDGYAYIKRDASAGPGVCGLAQENSYPVLE